MDPHVPVGSHHGQKSPEKSSAAHRPASPEASPCHEGGEKGLESRQRLPVDNGHRLRLSAIAKKYLTALTGQMETLP